MKKNVILLITAILLGACSKDSIRGEGPSRTEDRTLQVQAGLSSIRINGSTDAQITYGSSYKLEVRGYGNLLAALSTKVENQTLVVEYPNHYNVKNDNTKIILTIPKLPNLHINGKADADISGIFPEQESVEFTINGSSNINASNVITKTNFASYKVNGNGEINAYKLAAKNVEATISGNGEIKTNASTSLKARISGNGKIYYKGNPSIDSEISGSGKVIDAN